MISSKSSPPFLPDERQKTDASLAAEREKTNDSLVKSREDTEQLIDQSVVTERAKADQSTTTTRTAADANRDSDRNSENYDIRDERRNSDERLQEERRLADIAIDLERKRVDFAIDSERELKSTIANRLLSAERNITDQNLKEERFQTDTEFHHSSDLLEQEVSEHLKTKTSLTSREEILAIVSHDLRNPIGAASACASMLLEDPAYEKIDPEVRDLIVLIKQSADTSLRLIADLLDVERVAQGKLAINPIDCCMGDLVRETVETFKMAASAKSIQLRTTPFDINCESYCDPDRIRQVISNLIGNAIKFTPKGGMVTITVEPDNNTVQISITDTGPGIPEEKKAQIFERFAQIGSKNRTGLGLGLYISKMLVEAHGGKIWAESKIGEGSKFIFTIPRKKFRKD
ncbi:sensor histidine kinase [Bdellovibrio sp. HCB337]|uniref:sensor histidine kinase n=1 Tax=Bdellovibrio sp. HCB337 TaxID=3394358 RepID=UPI0039A65847